MPQNVGTVSTELQLDTRKALQQYNRFEQTVRQQSGRNSMFGAISADAREFDNSLGKATNRVVAFGAAAAIFSTLARSTHEFATSIIEVDKSLAAINVNLGQSAEGLKKFGADLFNIARQTGQTFEVTAKAAEELARQGLGAEETTKRLKDSLILSRIAGLDAASSVETLTAAINTFNKQALTSSEVVNKFAAVDTNFAVSSKDLAEGVSRVGSTAEAAGVGIDELIGLITSLQQTTARGGSAIGNGLKTIFTRIQAAPETVNTLQSMGIAIKNTDGSLRDAVSILRDYGVARQKVGEVERASLDRTVAGTFQINLLKAALGDLGKQYSIYNDAVHTSATATNEAIQKNEKLNATIASLLNSTALSVKQLFSNIGNQKLGPIFQDLLKNLEQVRSYFSGDSGDELGKSLGDGILKGLGNVLSGPAIVAIIVVLANAFKKVISTIAQEARTLLTINGAVQTRANIQRQINTLLGQATQQEIAQYQAASSVLAKKEQILAIQARINQEELIGSPVARSFQLPGRLNVGSIMDPRIRRGNSYMGEGIPRFADPISSAVNREQKASGLPLNQIYVDRDARVASFANPNGLLIANRRDEPLGGYQGVNRVISEGGNPKTAGMATPNFAAPGGAVERYNAEREVRSLFNALSKAKPLSEDFNKIGSQIQDASAKLGKAAQDNALGKLAKEFNNALISSRIVTDRARFTSFAPTPSGTIDESREIMDRNIARARQKTPSSGRILGPAYPINPDLQARMAAKAQELAYARAGIEPGTDYSSPIGPPTYQQNRREQLTAMTARFRRNRALREQRSIRNQNRALGAAFILPFAAGFIPDQESGTNAGVGVGAIKGAATGAGFGGILGPQGLVIGAAIGALVGGFSKITKSSEELAASIDKSIAERSQESDALTRTLTLREQLNSAIEEGASPATIRSLKNQIGEASGRVTSQYGRAALGIAPGAAQDEAIERYRQEQRRLNVAAEANKMLIGSDSLSSGALATTFKGGLSQDFVKSLTSQDIKGLGKLGSLNLDQSKIVGFQRGVSYSDEEEKEGKKQLEEFNKALADVSPVLGKFVDVTKVNIFNYQDVVSGFVKAINQYNQDLKTEDEIAKKTAATGLLRPNSFLNAPNLDVYRQAALTGRSPRAGIGQRSQSQYDFFQELISSGATSATVLESDPEFRRARAGVQRNNVANAAIAFLQGNNPSVGNLTNNLGDPNIRSIERLLEFTSKSGTRSSGNATRLLEYLRQGENTGKAAGLNTSVYSPTFSVAESGLAPGGKYKVTAGDALKQAQETVQKTLQSANATIIRTALQVDGTIKVMSDVKSSKELEQLAADLTAAIGKQFQAQITDLNVRLSKAEGNPIPPSPVKTNSTFGNNMVKGSDGFIRKAP